MVIFPYVLKAYLDTAAVKKAEYQKALEKYRAGTSSSTDKSPAKAVASAPKSEDKKRKNAAEDKKVIVFKLC